MLTKALDAAVDGNTRKAMHPARAKSGYKILQRMKQLVECKDFDDSASQSLIERMFFDSIPRKHVEIKYIEQVLRADLLKKFLRRVTADAKADTKADATSVEVCWHGTQQKYEKAILDEGLNPDLCSTGAYGRGAYVGTHAGIAHQYADPDEEGWRRMFLLLVVVGSSLVRGDQGKQANTTACDGMVNPTQYCFLEQDRLYCSHLITYRVLDMNNKRTGGGYQDPFQRKLEVAVCKAARNKNKSGLR